jgi:hypothetical protein
MQKLKVKGAAATEGQRQQAAGAHLGPQRPDNLRSVAPVLFVQLSTTVVAGDAAVALIATLPRCRMRARRLRCCGRRSASSAACSAAATSTRGTECRLPTWRPWQTCLGAGCPAGSTRLPSRGPAAGQRAPC